MTKITVRHIDADTNPMVALKHVEAWREGALIRIVLHTQNTRTNRSWNCATADAAALSWREALDALGYDVADQYQNDMIDKLLESTFGPATIVVSCSTAGHRHYGRAAKVRDPGFPIEDDRACALIDLAWHPVLSRADSVQRQGPWRVRGAECDVCGSAFPDPHDDDCSEK